MKFKKIVLREGAGKIYGFLFGMFLVGLHLRPAPNRPRMLFQRTVFRSPAYGLLVGPKFFGFCNPSTPAFVAWQDSVKQQAERKLQLEALLSATKQDIRYANAVVRLDVGAPLTPSEQEKVASILSGKEVLPPFRTDAEEYENLVKERSRTMQLGAAFPPMQVFNMGDIQPRPAVRRSTELSRKNLEEMRQTYSRESRYDRRREQEAELLSREAYWASDDVKNDIQGLIDALNSPPKISS